MRSWKHKLHDFFVGLQYSLLARRNYFLETRRFMNMGYWENGAESLDTACCELADQVAVAGAFAKTDHILDVGFGFGDQELYWMETVGPARIVGVDISPYHIKIARRRIRAVEGVALHLGSATDLRFPAETFDKVVSIEAAFQFSCRDTFFREALRVLQPGGRLVLTDLIPREKRGHALNQVSPEHNQVTLAEYKVKLEAAGFTGVSVTSMREQVCVPYCAHIAKMTADPASKLGWFSRWFLSGRGNPALYEGLDYIIAIADKPCREEATAA